MEENSDHNLLKLFNYVNLNIIYHKIAEVFKKFCLYHLLYYLKTICRDSLNLL